MTKLDRFTLVMLIALGLVLFFAYQDSVGFEMWKATDGFGSDAYIVAEPFYMKQFWLFASTTIILVGAIYYILTRNRGESVSLIVAPALLLLGGWEDIFYFPLTNQKLLGTTLPWLWGNPYLRSIAEFMGETTITANSLFVGAILSIILTILLVNYLVENYG